MTQPTSVYLQEIQELEEFSCRMMAVSGIPPGKSLEGTSLENVAHIQEKNKNTDTGDSEINK